MDGRGFNGGRRKPLHNHKPNITQLNKAGYLAKETNRDANAYKDFKRPLYGMKVGGSNESQK